ncbi:hypothetical protein MRB53_015412 [Persea americana]|uniref:Uncharacterized protein n=1 Tax=Persea americana TaxID=3435 RepID=A0ACC2KDN5_PERAE|nr:hypothetical protein MRB53_015412 [Persea americana]
MASSSSLNEFFSEHFFFFFGSQNPKTMDRVSVLISLIRREATVEIEISEDTQLVHFDFNGLGLEINDCHEDERGMQILPIWGDVMEVPQACSEKGAQIIGCWERKLGEGPGNGNKARAMGTRPSYLSHQMLAHLPSPNIIQ